VRFIRIGVGARSTLGEDIFARKYMYEKLRKCPHYIHDIFPKMPEFYMIIARKIFSRIWGQVPLLPPFSYASHSSVGLLWRRCPLRPTRYFCRTSRAWPRVQRLSIRPYSRVLRISADLCGPSCSPIFTISTTEKAITPIRCTIIITVWKTSLYTGNSTDKWDLMPATEKNRVCLSMAIIGYRWFIISACTSFPR